MDQTRLPLPRASDKQRINRMVQYNTAFYLDQMDESYVSAKKILGILFERYRPTSVVDLGCGVGTWLRACLDLGVTDIDGRDGDYVDRSLLKIPPECFHAADLSQPQTVGRRYDLAMSLEVAEHLERSSAENIVGALTRLSDVVLFSAAMPYQGGTGHSNENWLEYWAILFRRNDYVAVDYLRPLCWNSADVCFWYRQNVMLFAKRQLAPKLFPQAALADGRLLTQIHPELFLWACSRPRNDCAAYAADKSYFEKLTAAYCQGTVELPAQEPMYGPQNHVGFASQDATWWQGVKRRSHRLLEVVKRKKAA